MHVELAVPGLLQARAPVPALELLLARGRRRVEDAATLEAWYAAALGLGEAPLPAGALTALGAGLDAASGAWLRADPVHLRADRDRALLIPSQGFALAEDEARALAAALRRHFAEDFALHVVRPDAWCLQAHRDLPADGPPPAELAGADVDAALPDKRWHALLNEIQMALYQDETNTAREARGEPVVNSVWPWGGGALPEPGQARAPWQSLSADDPLAAGVARLAGLRHRPEGEDAAAWLSRAPEDGRHLVVLDAMRAARAMRDAEALDRIAARYEAAWFAPLLAALRSGRVGMVTVHVPEAGLAFETVRGDLRRFWRRARPLAAYEATEARA